MINQKFQKGFIQQAIPGILLIILLIAIVIFLFYYLKPSSRLPLPPTGGEDVFLAQKVYQPLIERTEDAYNVLSTDLPYQGPDFIITYLPGASLFVVDTQATTWEQYAERRRMAAQFFRDKGVDPCKIHVVWGSSPVLNSIGKPPGLDFGCTVNI